MEGRCKVNIPNKRSKSSWLHIKGTPCLPLFVVKAVAPFYVPPSVGTPPDFQGCSTYLIAFFFLFFPPLFSKKKTRSPSSRCVSGTSSRELPATSLLADLKDWRRFREASEIRRVDIPTRGADFNIRDTLLRGAPPTTAKGSERTRRTMRVVHTCSRRGCRKRPTYGVRGSRKRELCAKHALPGMINVDVARFVGRLVIVSPPPSWFMDIGCREEIFSSQCNDRPPINHS